MILIMSILMIEDDANQSIEFKRRSRMKCLRWFKKISEEKQREGEGNERMRKWKRRRENERKQQSNRHKSRKRSRYKEESVIMVRHQLRSGDLHNCS